MLAVETCGPLARLLNKSDSVQHVLPIVQKFAQVGSTPCQLHLALEAHALQRTYCLTGQQLTAATNWQYFNHELVLQAALFTDSLA